jgi:hypothetical protein
MSANREAKGESDVLRKRRPPVDEFGQMMWYDKGTMRPWSSRKDRRFPELRMESGVQVEIRAILTGAEE